MFRRRAQRIFRGLGIPNVPPMFQQANQLMSAGDYAGAAVRPDEVEWLDDVTAECDYCGSPVRGE